MSWNYITTTHIQIYNSNSWILTPVYLWDNAKNAENNNMILAYTDGKMPCFLKLKEVKFKDTPKEIKKLKKQLTIIEIIE